MEETNLRVSAKYNPEHIKQIISIRRKNLITNKYTKEPTGLQGMLVAALIFKLSRIKQ